MLGFFLLFFLFNFILLFSSLAIFLKIQLLGQVNYEHLACWYVYSQSLHQTCTNVYRCHACRSKANIHLECSPEAALNHCLCNKARIRFILVNPPVIRTPQICHKHEHHRWKRMGDHTWTDYRTDYRQSCSSVRGDAAHERITHIHRKFSDGFIPGITPVSTNMTV